MFMVRAPTYSHSYYDDSASAAGPAAGGQGGGDSPGGRPPHQPEQPKDAIEELGRTVLNANEWLKCLRMQGLSVLAAARITQRRNVFCQGAHSDAANAAQITRLGTITLGLVKPLTETAGELSVAEVAEALTPPLITYPKFRPRVLPELSAKQ